MPLTKGCQVLPPWCNGSWNFSWPEIPLVHFFCVYFHSPKGWIMEEAKLADGLYSTGTKGGVDAMVPHTFRWPQTPFDSTWKLLKRINMLDLNTRETKPCLWLRAVTYDVSDWIAAVLSPCDLCLFELGHPGAVPRYQLNCLPTWIEQKTKVRKCISIFSLPLLRWLQWKIHLLQIISSSLQLAFMTSSLPHESFLSSGGIEMPMSQLIINLNSGCIHWQCQPGSSLYCDPWVVPLCIKDSIY